MQASDHVLRWHAHRAYEQCGFLFYNDGDEVVQSALHVVVVGLAGDAADGGQCEVDAEESVGLEEGF